MANNKENNKNNVLCGLRKHGYTDKNGFIESVFSKDRIDAVREIIKTHLIPIKNVSYHYGARSYVLKHVIERFAYHNNNTILGNYITNGECIYAMYLEGYTVKRDSDGKNARFNVSKRSVDALQAVVSKIES